MKHILYKTTNIITNEYYLGIHSTPRINDGYIGSGKILKLAIKKYGKKNFRREVLFYLETRDELLLKEKEIINKEVLQDPLCLNIALGGIISNGSDKCRDNCKSSAKRRWTDLENRKRQSELIKGKRKSHSYHILISPSGIIYNLEDMDITLSDFCKKFHFTLRMVIHYCNKGKIQFSKPVKCKETLNLENWEIRRIGRP